MNLTGGVPLSVSLSQVEMTYGTETAPVHALAPVTLSIDSGEFLVLLGASGCGKTTLLRLIAGLLKPSGGKIEFDGQPLWNGSQRNAKLIAELGIVFQDANLFPWFTVAENIALPLKLRGVGAAERRARAQELCDLVGIEGFEHRWPRELSGGMRQRAAIARALSYQPQVLLMDEPFGALDAMTREAMNLELQRIWQRSGCTVVMVTHSINEAVFLADRVVLLSPRPGRIDKIMPVGFDRPRTYALVADAGYQSIAQDLRQRLSAIA